MIELLKNQKLKGQFRHALTFFGGIAVGKGVIGEDALNSILGNFDAIVGGVGAVVAVAGSVMSWRSKKETPSNGTPIVPMVVLAGCLLISGASGCASPTKDTAQNYQTNWLADDLGEFPVLVPKN